MIAFLEGMLVVKEPARALINVGGVGYEVQIPLSSYDALPLPGQPVRVLTCYHVREDAHILFGFMTEAERRMFMRLNTVNGIGPKVALNALSGMTVRDITCCIIEGDSKRLSSIPGIGKKTAERIVVDLKDKFDEADRLQACADAGAHNTSSDTARLRDVTMALVSLGFKQVDAQKMAQLAAERAGVDAPVEEIIRISLARQ